MSTPSVPIQLRPALLALLLVAAVGARATESASLESRLLALESKLAQLADENTALKKQLGVEGKAPPAFVTAGGKEKRLSLGGYLQGQAEFGDAPDTRFGAGYDRFYLRRARVTIKGSFAEHFDFNLTTDLAPNTLGATSAARVQAVDVFAVWNKYSEATVTFGQFKTPYGYEQLLPDTKVLSIERSLPNDQLTLSRQLGAMVSGVAVDKKLTYALGLFNGNGINTSANDNDQFLYVGRVTGVIHDDLRFKFTVGANAFTTRDTGASFTGRRTGTGLDLQAVSGPVGFYAEYLRMHSDREAGADTDAHGWSVLGTCFVVPKTLQALVRYEVYDPNRGSGGDDSALWTAGLTWLLKGDDLKFSVNYLFGDPAGTLHDQGRLLTRMQIIF